MNIGSCQVQWYNQTTDVYRRYSSTLNTQNQHTFLLFLFFKGNLKHSIIHSDWISCQGTFSIRGGKRKIKFVNHVWGITLRLFLFGWGVGNIYVEYYERAFWKTWNVANMCVSVCLLACLCIVSVCNIEDTLDQTDDKIFLRQPLSINFSVWVSIEYPVLFIILE